MAQGARKIGFAGFQRAVELLAEERRCDVEAVRRAVVLSGGPHANTHVTPDYVRLHDDKSTYSGAAPPWLLLKPPVVRVTLRRDVCTFAAMTLHKAGAMLPLVAPGHTDARVLCGSARALRSPEYVCDSPALMAADAQSHCMTGCVYRRVC